MDRFALVTGVAPLLAGIGHAEVFDRCGFDTAALQWDGSVPLGPGETVSNPDGVLCGRWETLGWAVGSTAAPTNPESVLVRSNSGGILTNTDSSGFHQTPRGCADIT
jgi:hypothetical protein